MKITINNKDYELKFSIKNINKIDQVFASGDKGDQFGAGTLNAVSSLIMYNSVALDKVITCLTPDDLTQEMIDDYISGLTEKELEKLFEGLIAEAKKSPMISLQWRRITGQTMTQSINSAKTQLKKAQNQK